MKKHLTKKERKQKKQMLSGGDSESTLDDEESHHPDNRTNVRDYKGVCASALLALQAIYRTNSDLLEIQLIQKIQKVVFPLALQVIDSSERPFPYESDTCRKELYILISECSSLSYENLPAPMAQTIGILTEARGDSSFEVSMVAEMALNKLTQIIHPSGPALDVPVNYVRNGHTALGALSSDEEEMSEIDQLTSNSSIGLNGSQPEDPNGMEIDDTDNEEEEEDQSRQEEGEEKNKPLEEKEQEEEVKLLEEEVMEKPLEEKEEEEEERYIKEPSLKRLKPNEYDSFKEDRQNDEFISLGCTIEESTPLIASLSNVKPEENHTEHHKKEIDEVWGLFGDNIGDY